MEYTKDRVSPGPLRALRRIFIFGAVGLVAGAIGWILLAVLILG